MTLNRRQITVIVASILTYQKEFIVGSDLYQELEELIEVLDVEHQKLAIEPYKQEYGG